MRKTYTAELTRKAAAQYLREVEGWSTISIDIALGAARLHGYYGNKDITFADDRYRIVNGCAHEEVSLETKMANVEEQAKRYTR